MGTHSVLTRNHSRHALVASGMRVVRGGADLPEDLRAVADAAFNEAYNDGVDELYAALAAVDPLIRHNELQSMLDLLRYEVGQMAGDRGMIAGVCRAIELLEYRQLDLAS